MISKILNITVLQNYYNYIQITADENPSKKLNLFNNTYIKYSMEQGRELPFIKMSGDLG